MITYTYKAFGLIFRSEIEIPEFIPHEEEKEMDVTIQPGTTPEILEDATARGVLFEGTKNRFLLTIPNTGKVFITNGNNIILEKYDGASWDDIRVFLLSSGMGALLHQRGLLPMHASTIEWNNQGVMFMGNSGVGKSTLAAACAKQGAAVLADDISLVDTSGRQPQVIPAFPQVKLWEDSLRKLEENHENLQKVRAELGKYWKNIRDNFKNEPKPVERAFLLSPMNKNDFGLKKIQGIEKFNVLKNNTYKFRFISGTGLEKNHFAHISRFANGVELYKLERPTGSFDIQKLVNLIRDQQR